MGDGSDLAVDAGYSFLIFNRQGERTGTFIIHTKIFRIRTGNQQLLIVFQECTQAIGIFFQAVAEALVGKVKQQQPALFSRKSSQNSPLFGHRVDIDRIVAAAVQRGDVVFLRLAQAFNHAIPIQAIFSGIIVAIGSVLDTDRFGGCVMVWPGRIGDPDGLYVQLTLGKLSRNMQCAYTAKALRCLGATARDDFMVPAKQQNLSLFVVVGNTTDGQVVFGCFTFQQAFFSLFDGLDSGYCTGCALVHIDTGIDFFGTGFGSERFTRT